MSQASIPGGEAPSQETNSLESPLLFRLTLFCLLISAFALYFAQPGTGGTGLLAGAALLPFLAALESRRSRAALGWGYLWGVFYFIPLLSWLRPFGYVAWLGLAIAEAMFSAFFAIMAVPLLRRGGWPAIWGVAALWVVFERIRMMISFGFTWGDLSLASVNLPPLLHTASWWGAPGLSLFFAVLNTALWSLLRPRLVQMRDIATEESVAAPALHIRRDKYSAKAILSHPGQATLLLLAIILLLGTVGWQHRRSQITHASPLVRVGLVQVNQARKIFTGIVENPEGVFAAHAAMTADLARQGCQWVIWPESALPESLSDRYRRLAQVARQNHVYVLAGGLDDAPPNLTYNSAFCFGPDGRMLGRYSKRRRVPFGEYVPFRKYLPSLARFGVPASDLNIGHSEGVIRGGNVRVGVNICFESFFSEPALAQRREGAQFLAVPTNDSYYGFSPAATTHAAYLRMRSVETGLPGVQAAITGFSLATRPDGSVIGSTSLFQEASLIATLPQPCPVTLWVKAPWLIWSFLGLFILSSYRIPRLKRRKELTSTSEGMSERPPL